MLGVLADMDQSGSYSRQWHVLGWYWWLLWYGFVLCFCGSCLTCFTVMDLPENSFCSQASTWYTARDGSIFDVTGWFVSSTSSTRGVLGMLPGKVSVFCSVDDCCPR